MSSTKHRNGVMEEESVQSLARGLAVIESFGHGRSSLTLSEVARRADISRAAARRLLHTLVNLGYAAFDGKQFELRPRVLSLGYAYLAATGVWDIATPFMEELVRETRESCSASVLDGTEIVHVVRLPAAARLMSIAIKVGDRLPAYASAMGRVQLAALPDAQLRQYLETVRMQALTPRTVTDPKRLEQILLQIRKQGYAEVDGELEAGLNALAVPVHDAQDRVVGAIALSTPSDAGTGGRKSRVPPLLAPVLACTARIREALARMPNVKR
jgi:IclR family pca regulon transcriptional regulator